MMKNTIKLSAQTIDYFNRIVRHNLERDTEEIKNATTEVARRFHEIHLDAEYGTFSKAMGISEEELWEIFSGNLEMVTF